MTAEQAASESPYSRAADQLAALGYHVIPIGPGSKAPGLYSSGQWWGFKDWQRYRDAAPTQFERRHWGARWPDAGVGIVLGTRIGAHQLIAIDIDTQHADDFDTLARALAASPMTKRGRKGETRFYRAPLTIKSHSWWKEGLAVCDILTGEQTRQTVVPPSIHPQGSPYVWLAGPVALADLPIFGDDEMARYVEALESIGATRNRAGDRAATPPRPPRDPDDGESLWEETKREAMSRLSEWVLALDLYDLRPARGGFECVAHWRPSSTGRALSERKRNLSIHPTGIVDFGTGETYTPIDLVMRARNCGQEAATTWLRDQLGISAAPIVLTQQPARVEIIAEMVDEAYELPAAPEIGDELPTRLTRVTGLVGALADWICASARRPQPALALVSALVTVGVAAGRTYAGPTRTGTHLYALALAPSGGGKEHPLRACARALSSAGMTSRVGPGQFVSMPSVISAIQRSPHCFVAPIDEFGSFLGRINNKRASSFEGAISGELRSLWGINFEAYSTPEWASRKAEIIQAPALSILGVSTHEEFYAALNGTDVVNGFLNRFLLVSTARRPADQDPDEDKARLADHIIADLRQIGAPRAASIMTMSGGPCEPAIRAQWGSVDAKEAWRAFARRLELIEQGASFYARTAEIAQRIATIKAIGDDPLDPRISLADVEWACAVAEWSAHKMRQECEDYLAETDNQANAQRIMRVIKEAGREITYRELQQALRHRIKTRDLRDLLDGLVEAGDITLRLEKSPTGGPAQKWFAPGQHWPRRR